LPRRQTTVPRFNVQENPSLRKVSQRRFADSALSSFGLLFITAPLFRLKQLSGTYSIKMQPELELSTLPISYQARILLSTVSKPISIDCLPADISTYIF